MVITLKSFNGEEARKYFPQIADMRITMFKKFPYLYKGNIEHEKDYLEIYFKSLKSKVLLIFEGDEVVGYSSALPLNEEMEVIQKPFIDNNLDMSKYLYINDIMIKKAYRGQGFLRQYFEQHENHAKTHKFKNLIFMTIKRPYSHPFRPANYRDLKPLWQHFGYQLMPKQIVRSSWTQSDTFQEEKNELEIWIKDVMKN